MKRVDSRRSSELAEGSSRPCLTFWIHLLEKGPPGVQASKELRMALAAVTGPSPSINRTEHRTPRCDEIHTGPRRSRPG
jgi:hypothetical protein